MDDRSCREASEHVTPDPRILESPLQQTTPSKHAVGPVAPHRRFHGKVHHEQHPAGKERFANRGEEASELFGGRAHVRIIEHPGDELADDRNSSEPDRTVPVAAPGAEVGARDEQRADEQDERRGHGGGVEDPGRRDWPRSPPCGRAASTG